MADNTQINTGSGDIVRDIDRTGQSGSVAAKTQVLQIDAGGQYRESLVAQGNPLPVANLLQNEGGLSNTDLLTQILVELRVLTRQLAELPTMLNGNASVQPDQPEAMRADPSLFPFNQLNS